MVTLQDISFRLMKPAKDLADWNFPLSQILEEYYALLEEPCSINFGEAALVLQNSANVYVHRVERLFGETERFGRSFVDREQEENRKLPSQGRKKGTSESYANVCDFAGVNFEKDVGRAIDLKKRRPGQKRTKLLTRRFTQLETSAPELRIPIEVYDVYGEVVGKKYDFRCNRDTNASGALVDELTPNDLIVARTPCIKERRNPSLTSSEAYTQETGTTSGYHSNASPYECSATADVSTEEFDPFSPAPPLEPPDHEAPTPDEDLPSETKNGQIDMNNVSKDATPTENDVHELSGKLETVVEERVTEMKEEEKEKLTEAVQIRRSGRTKKAIQEVEDLNEDLWRPIPLTSGTKNSRSEYSSPLKLPAYVSLLKTKLESRKRKVTTRIPKPECLARFVLRELGTSEKEMTSSSSIVESTFRPLRKHELEDFQRSFDECFSTRKEDVRYEPVKDSSSSDLLGFRLREDESEIVKDRDETPSPVIFDPRPESSSESSESNQEEFESDSNREFGLETNETSMRAESPRDSDWFATDLSYALPQYKTLIENRMREILKESNVATELENAVAKWHESLRSKLTDAELRSTFRIHDYASRILGTLETLEQRKTAFDNMVRGQPACEVARYFLASLQLANTYDVQINASDSSANNIEIVLLEGQGQALKNGEA